MGDTEVNAILTKYPPDQTRVGRGLCLAIGVHLFVAVTVSIILYTFGIVSLKELLEKGGSIASSGPAPEQQMMVEIKLEDLPPPPADHIEFMRQIVKEVVSPPKPPELKPTPKPVPKIQPRFTAPKATGSGNSMAVSAFVKGTSGLPIPGYPQAALQAGQGGTVMMHVVFGSSGDIENAEIIGSSGVILLDTWTRNFIYEHWKNASMAGRDVHVPIIYDPSQRAVH